MAKKRPLDADKWLSPKTTLEIAKRSCGGVAAQTILNRLRAGLLIATASQTSDSDDNGDPNITDEPLPIPSTHWLRLQDENAFWNAGDAQFFWHDAIWGNRITHCTGIKFLAKHINDMFPAPEKPAALGTHARSEATDDPKAKGPPVSPAALNAWHAAYKLAYQGAEDTLAKAYESAEGMFPGKFVSRQRIRDLVGGRRIGRKAK